MSSGPGQSGADLPPDAFTPPTSEDLDQGRQLFSEYARRYPRLAAETCALTVMPEPYKSQAFATVDALCRVEPWAGIPSDLLVWWLLGFVHRETPGYAPFLCRILRRLALMLAHAEGQALSESDLAWLAAPEPLLQFVQALEGRDVTEATARLFEGISQLDGAGLEKALSKIGWLVREAGRAESRASATRIETQCGPEQA